MDQELAARARQLAADIGYVACGITTAEPFDRYAEALGACIRAFPEASPLYQPLRIRVDPRRDAPWVHSVVVCIRRYGKYRLPGRLGDHIGRNYLADRRSESCPDHDWPARMTEGLRELGLRLKRGGCPDRAAAARAGVARIGRNGFAYHPTCGSWLNIETWRIDAGLPPDEPTYDVPCPPECRACMDACPTGAIVGPFLMRLDRCVAYLTYHAPWPVAPDLWARMGPWVYGCDACQLACPLNRGKWMADEPAPWLDAVREELRLEFLATMDARTYRDVVHPLFWYISPDDLDRWHDNARRALEHGGAKS